MIRALTVIALLTLISLSRFIPISTVNAADPTPTPEPTFEVEVVVETQGIGIPDDAVMETGLGNLSSYRRETLGPNHYRDFLKVRLDSTVVWIFEHEGNLSTGGQRSDESWESFPVIAPTPLTLTVSIRMPVTSCQDPTTQNCNSVLGVGSQPVFILEHNQTYNINLQVDYTRGASHDQDNFTVTSLAVSPLPTATFSPSVTPTPTHTPTPSVTLSPMPIPSPTLTPSPIS